MLAHTLSQLKTFGSEWNWRVTYLAFPLLVHAGNAGLSAFSNMLFSVDVLAGSSDLWLPAFAAVIDVLAAIIIYGASFPSTVGQEADAALEPSSEYVGDEVANDPSKSWSFYKTLHNRRKKKDNVKEGEESNLKKDIDSRHILNQVKKSLKNKAKERLPWWFSGINMVLSATLALSSGIVVSFSGVILADLADFSNPWILTMNVAVTLVAIWVTYQYSCRNMQESLEYIGLTLRYDEFSEMWTRLKNEWNARKTWAVVLALVGATTNLLFAFYAFKILLPPLVAFVGLPASLWQINAVIYSIVVLAGIGSVLDFYHSIKKILNPDYVVDDTQSVQKNYLPDSERIRFSSHYLAYVALGILIISGLFNPTGSFSSAIRLGLGWEWSIVLASLSLVVNFISNVPAIPNQCVRGLSAMLIREVTASSPSPSADSTGVNPSQPLIGSLSSPLSPPTLSDRTK